jgi:hypothetical protein
LLRIVRINSRSSFVRFRGARATQVEIAFNGLCDQRTFTNNIEPKNSIETIKAINKEIERNTISSMKLIQEFTEIAKPPEGEKPWLRKLTIKFDEMKIESGNKNKFGARA